MRQLARSSQSPLRRAIVSGMSCLPGVTAVPAPARSEDAALVEIRRVRVDQQITDVRRRQRLEQVLEHAQLVAVGDRLERGEPKAGPVHEPRPLLDDRPVQHRLERVRVVRVVVEHRERERDPRFGGVELASARRR